MKDLDAKNVVITGGSYGIGVEIARAFVCEGANVYIIARDRARLDASVADLERSAMPNRTVRGFSCDVTDKLGITTTIDTIASEAGGIDVLVNNAGIVIPGYFEDQPIEDFEKVMYCDYFGSLYATKAALPHLLRHKQSAVTFTSSVAGLKGVFGYSTYSPAKFALIGLAETIRQELKCKGVQVTVLYPPDTDTPGFEEEKKCRPKETDVIAGSAGLAPPAEVAEAFLNGFRKGKFTVNPSFDGKLLFRMRSIWPWFTDLYFDMMVKKGKKST
jgi:3-dehydrosphinganine reductase